MPQKSVLLVDCQAMFLEMLTSFLGRELPDMTFITAASLKEARLLMQHHAFDLLIADISGLESAGLSMILEVREHAPGTKMLLLAAEVSTFWLHQSMREGVLGIVTKSRPLSELVGAIREVLAGRKHLSPEIAQQFMDYISFLQTGDPMNLLSRRELEVFLKIGEGRPLKSIATELGLSAGTVAVHKHNIARKTGIDSVAKIARYCLEHGMLEIKPEQILLKTRVARPAAVAA